jgi:hypothetical protein
MYWTTKNLSHTFYKNGAGTNHVARTEVINFSVLPLPMPKKALMY